MPRVLVPVTTTGFVKAALTTALAGALQISLLVTVISPPGLTVPGPVNTKSSMLMDIAPVVMAGTAWDTGPGAAMATPVDPRPAPAIRAAVNVTLRTLCLVIMRRPSGEASKGTTIGPQLTWRTVAKNLYQVIFVTHIKVDWVTHQRPGQHGRS